MAVYRINFLNAGSDIVDPVITVQRKLNGLDPDAMTVDVTVYFTVTDSNQKETRLGLLLEGVSVPNLTYNEAGLYNLVMIKLQEFLIP